MALRCGALRYEQEQQWWRQQEQQSAAAAAAAIAMAAAGVAATATAAASAAKEQATMTATSPPPLPPITTMATATIPFDARETCLEGERHERGVSNRFVCFYTHTAWHSTASMFERTQAIGLRWGEETKGEEGGRENAAESIGQ